MGMSNLELFALVVLIVALAAGLEIWVRIDEAGKNIMATLDAPEVKGDEAKIAEDVAYRNRMIYEADQYNEAASMEPFCGEGKKP